MEEYKNILWIEDCDTKNPKAKKGTSWLDDEEEDQQDNSDLIEEYFGTEQACCVHLVKEYLPALEILRNNCNAYDLIVFDLDFKDVNIQNNGKKYQKILSMLEEGHVKPSAERAVYTNFEKIAGYYLYLYLAMQGYPTNRMAILTGNAGNYQNDHPDLLLKENTDIIVKQHNSDWLKKYYSGKKNKYYRIRRLVFQACEYWKQQLNDKNPEEIPFNRIYYKKNPILTEVFIDMLEHIQMLFPVTRPDCPEKNYYQAMQTAASLHEESAKVSSVDNYPDLKKYHSCIRNFRNWTAHNKLQTKNQRSLDGEQFALLFCIAMRTYFDTNKPEIPVDAPEGKPNGFSSVLLNYEKLYGFDSIDFSAVDSIELSEKFIDIWLTVSQNAGFGETSLNLDTAVREYGRQTGVNMSPCYLFLPLWSSDIQIHAEQVPQKDKKNVMIQYTIPSKICQTICTELKKDTTDAVFLRYCYRWL